MNGFKFIDLFAGIGGIRIAFENNGGKCVFSSEYDKFSQITYETFFGEKPIYENDCNELLFGKTGDITKLSSTNLIQQCVPDHDILTGGFPCQPFSLAGVSKKNSLGRPHGFDDETQGTLFFNVKQILSVKKPKAFLLENVKNLRSHDKGNTFAVISQNLEDLGYEIADRVIDAKGWVPQHRERIYIVGIRKPENKEYDYVSSDELQRLLDGIEPPVESIPLTSVIEHPDLVPDKYTLGPGTWNTLLRHKAHHESIGQGFGYGMINPEKDEYTRTISARYHKDGAEILIDQEELGKDRPRRLTPLECCRLMGFPFEYQKFFERDKDMQPVSDTQAYRQFGNSVVVPVVIDVAKVLVKKLREISAIK